MRPDSESKATTKTTTRAARRPYVHQACNFCRMRYVQTTAPTSLTDYFTRKTKCNGIKPIVNNTFLRAFHIHTNIDRSFSAALAKRPVMRFVIIYHFPNRWNWLGTFPVHMGIRKCKATKHQVLRRVVEKSHRGTWNIHQGSRKENCAVHYITRRSWRRSFPEDRRDGVAYLGSQSAIRWGWHGVLDGIRSWRGYMCSDETSRCMYSIFYNYFSHSQPSTLTL